MRTFALTLLILMGAALGASGSAVAQEGPGGAINPHRDCQTLLTCNFKKGGSWRGCVSSYSCRRCEFVSAPCKIGGSKRRHCQRMDCGWSGS
ncbi:hypothetical protein DLM45_12050 [Hyphomicrobium methylovorum]|nr:hypothetical protein [Hyphomicrobium methylovorum]